MKKFFILLGSLFLMGNANAEKCLHWKNECHQETVCAHLDEKQDPTCFRCIKPSQYNFHAYTRAVDRTVCNPRTADYLRTMGYRCYKPSSCIKFTEKTVCDEVCVTTKN
jgi:hypothetical protein